MHRAGAAVQVRTVALGLNEARQLLLARLADLRAEDDRASESVAPVTLDQDSVGRLSRVDALQMQAMALAAQRRRAAEKIQIDAALKRVQNGTMVIASLAARTFQTLACGTIPPSQNALDARISS